CSLFLTKYSANSNKLKIMSTYINSSTTPDRLRKFSAGISNTHMLLANDENNFDIDENDFDETKQHSY
ncbi:unnamed protein product, partial [Rotaria sordida]